MHANASSKGRKWTRRCKWAYVFPRYLRGRTLKHWCSLARLTSACSREAFETTFLQVWRIHGSALKAFAYIYQAHALYVQTWDYLWAAWITNFKHILNHIDSETKIENQWQPSLQRKKDVFLMEAYSKFTKDAHTLKIMNNCRIHLKIITLSDITSADGKKLIKTQLNGH